MSPNELKIHPLSKSFIQIPLGPDGTHLIIQCTEGKKELDAELRQANANDRLAIIESPNNATAFFNPKLYSVFYTFSVSKLQIVPAGAIPDIHGKDVQ